MVVDPGTKQGGVDGQSGLVVLLLEYSRSTANNLIVVLGSRLSSKFLLEAWAEEVSLGISGHTL